MSKMLFGGIAVLAMAAMPVYAQTTPKATAQAEKQTTPRKTIANATTPDARFARNAAQGGMAEVEFGKLAADRATSQQVKDFGQKMVDDHTKAHDELASVAQNKNITLPSELSARDKAQRDRLSKLSGSAFDRAYMQTVVSNHRTDVTAFRQESKMGKDPDFKAFASRTLPTVEDHLKMAQTTGKAVVGTTGTVKKAKAKD